MGFAMISLSFRRINSKDSRGGFLTSLTRFSIFPALLRRKIEPGENPRPKIPTRFLSAAVSYNLDLGSFIFVRILFFFCFYHSLWRLSYCGGKLSNFGARTINMTRKNAWEFSWFFSWLWFDNLLQKTLNT